MTEGKTPTHRIESAGATTGDVLRFNGTDPVWAALAELVQDIVAAALVEGTGIDVTYDDTAGTITIATTGGGGGSLTVQDENSNVSTSVTQIDFQGAGVTATSGTGEVVVTIPGYSDEQARDAIGTALVAGANVTITVNDGADTITIAATGSGGGGFLGQTYLGYNTVGGSYETFTANKHLMKKITLSSAGMLATIEAYIKDSGSSQVGSLAAAVASDVSGTPTNLIALGGGRWTGDTVYLNTTARWISLPIGMWLPAGDYWIMLACVDNTSLQIAYDGSGSDRYYTSGGVWIADPTQYTVTTGSNKYSIRASILS